MLIIDYLVQAAPLKLSCSCCAFQLGWRERGGTLTVSVAIHGEESDKKEEGRMEEDVTDKGSWPLNSTELMFGPSYI